MFNEGSILDKRIHLHERLFQKLELEKTHYSVPGVYFIRNKTNTNIYIGESKNIYKRLRQHFNFINGSYSNKRMFLDMCFENGVENDFTFGIIKIEEDTKNRKKVEAKIINQLLMLIGKGKLYNHL